MALRFALAWIIGLMFGVSQSGIVAAPQEPQSTVRKAQRIDPDAEASAARRRPKESSAEESGRRPPEPAGDVRPLLQPQNEGVLITRVFRNSPAAFAGLEVDDIILEVNQTRVRGLQELSDALRDVRGRALLLVLNHRDGQKVSVEIRPDQDGRIGILGRAAEVPGPAPQIAVQITRVWDNSPAARAGLETDDLILEVNDRSIQQLDDLRWALEQARGPVELLVRDHRTGRHVGVYVRPNQQGKIGVSATAVPWPSDRPPEQPEWPY